MKGVRFLDPVTEEIIYPGGFETPGDPLIPPLGTPTQPVGPYVVNALLAPATIPWDVRRSFQTHSDGWHQEELVKLSQSGTLPPIASMEIQSPGLPWMIKVHPKTPNTHITVFDVVAAIYATLKHRIARGEWELLGDQQKEVILMARNERVQGYDFSRAVDELYNHPRRVDALGEFTKFAGLVPTPQRGPNSFELRFDRGS